MQIEVGREFAGYQIVRHIGGGGMAQIYLAKTTGLAGFEKFLALKVINREYATEPRFIQMLINEAKIAVDLAHVNIAQVFDLSECNGIYYIAMEYVDGLDVLELVNGLHSMERHVPVEAVVYIGRQICSGLHYAHTRKDKTGTALNIVHRDISPQNIIVSRAGEVKVVDFGIAKAAGVRTRTQAGVIKGKVNYMAPEQVLGKQADARTDIFAAGIVVWEMLTSQMVYSGDNVEELAAKVRKANIAPPSSVRPEVPAELDEIVLRALHPNQKERYQTAHEFQVEVTKFLSTTFPEYSSSNLAQLIEGVLGEKPTTDIGQELAHVLSHEDRLEDEHSVIFKRRNHAELLVKLPQGDQSHTVTTDVTIGRAGDLAIPDARVSRQHARVRRVGTNFLVEDLGSSNGTYVDGRRVTGPYMLHDGNDIRVGSCHIIFHMFEESKQPVEEDETAQGVNKPAHLVISSGDQQVEQRLGGDVELGYEITLGPIRLTGPSGTLVRRPDGYWIEPAGSRTLVNINDKKTSQPVRLSLGDRFDVDGIEFSLKD